MISYKYDKYATHADFSCIREVECRPQWCSIKHLLKHEEQAAGDEDEPHSERKNTALMCHHDPSITVKAILSRKYFPFPLAPPGLLLSASRRSRSCWGSRCRCRQCMRIYLLIFTAFHGFLVVNKNCHPVCSPLKEIFTLSVSPVPTHTVCPNKRLVYTAAAL